MSILYPLPTILSWERVQIPHLVVFADRNDPSVPGRSFFSSEYPYDGGGGFHDPQSARRIAYKTVSDLNQDADNASAGDNQAGCCLLFVFSVGHSPDYLVEGVACLACKIGSRFLIDRGDLDRFIDARLRERML